MRRGLPLLLVGLALAAGCADDGGSAEGAGAPTTSTVVTTTTEVVPLDTTFVTEDVDALCDRLEGLRDIDPAADPTQADVDRLRAIATTAPPGVGDRLVVIADYGQQVVDGERDVEGEHTDAAEAATVLIAYGNEACAIDVPLFDAIAGV